MVKGICPCGVEFEYTQGRGRPRLRCFSCSPYRTRASRVTTPRSRDRQCSVCGSHFEASASALYCSNACKWKVTARLACSQCGGPTGWKASRRDVSNPTCNSCRGDYSRFDHGTVRGYRNAGCRCSECKEWNRQQHIAFRCKRRAEGRPIRHFGGSGYWIPERVRFEVFARDAWTCQLCGDPTDRSAPPNSDWFPSLDHIVPASKGGTHTAENLRVAHRWCNAVRGAEDYHTELFMEA